MDQVETKRIRALAMYLPQFYPIPENDEWWGKGFTEWTNVTKARSLFRGHYQPQLPTDLGFYDLRVPEVMEQQASMAREAGIYGFMFYHYWLSGKLMLERPLHNYRDKLTNKIPYCLCWANHDWTRRWDGADSEVLLEQRYSTQDDIEHMIYLIDFFRDPQYLRIDGRPVLAVYEAHLLPDPKRTTAIWRDIACRNGCGDLYLITIDKGEIDANPEITGFDAAMEFHPAWRNPQNELYEPFPLYDFLLRSWHSRKTSFVARRVLKPMHSIFENLIIDYEAYAAKYSERPLLNFKRFPGVMPGWDNSPRRPTGSAVIFHNATPSAYGNWLRGVLNRFEPYSPEENLLLINAWNEWAEGNHLEPCRRWGSAYLEETRRALAPYGSASEPQPESNESSIARAKPA